MKNFSLRIYKDEYLDEHLRYIRKKFYVQDETDRTITIYGLLSDLAKVQKCVYCNDTTFKEHFTDYITSEERREFNKQEIKAMLCNMQDSLLRITNYGVINSDFQNLRNVYFNLKEHYEL